MTRFHSTSQIHPLRRHKLFTDKYVIIESDKYWNIDQKRKTSLKLLKTEIFSRFLWHKSFCQGCEENDTSGDHVQKGDIISLSV